MKVICIDASAYPPIEGSPDDILKNGKAYFVTDVFMSEGYIFYCLDGNNYDGYWEDCFARVTDIDETTFERNYQKETV